MAEKDNTLGRHEILHMSSFFMLNVDQFLLGHPEIQKNAEWHEMAQKAHTALFDLYQSIGRAT